jgi:hypothetical protein
MNLLDNYDVRDLGKLELLAKQVVEGFIIGLHKSPFHGFSVEFAEHRLYNQGEDTKNIDWKVYARTDRLYTKRFEEETNLRCQIVIDASSSMYFPEATGKGAYTNTAISHVAMENSHEGSKTPRIAQSQRFLFVNLCVLVSSCPPYKTLAGGCGKKKATWEIAVVGRLLISYSLHSSTSPWANVFITSLGW